MNRSGLLPGGSELWVCGVVELWGPAGPTSSHALRGGNENGNPSDVVI